MYQDELYFEVVDWSSLQHYSNRDPPWIKLHSKFLRKMPFLALPDEARSHLFCIWMLASQNGGRVVADPRQIEAAIRAHTPIDFSLLTREEEGFLRLVDADGKSVPVKEMGGDASIMLAARYQDASTMIAPYIEVEEEVEVEVEEEKKEEVLSEESYEGGLFGVDEATEALREQMQRLDVEWDLSVPPDEWVRSRLRSNGSFRGLNVLAEIRNWGDHWERVLLSDGRKNLSSPSRALLNWMRKAKEFLDDRNATEDESVDPDEIQADLA